MSVRAPAANSVKRALVVADRSKDGVREAQGELLPWLRERLESVETAGDRGELYAAPLSASRPDLVVVLGGDGTILSAVRAFADSPVPTVGINFGRVGFLSSTPARHWREVLTSILQGEGVVEPRMRLETRIEYAGGKSVRELCLNDVVVSRGPHQGMLTLGLSVGGNWVTDYRADGLIVATPSGSTAHSLSAGGPVLFPSMLGLVVTPICPQGLSYRPIVLDPESRLELVIKDSSGATTVAADGQGFHELSRGDRVLVERHPLPYPLLAWGGLDPYRRLRERLGWSGLIAPDPAPAEED
jgi:NAD+ kinase